MMSLYHGRNCIIGVAVNGNNSGTTYGGTPGAYDYFRAKIDGAELSHNAAKEYVEENDIDPRFIEHDGVYFTGRVRSVLSYSYREKIFQLIMGGAITTTGGTTEAYHHAIALADEPLFGAVEFWFTDQAAAGTVHRVTDVLLTSLMVEEERAKAPEMEFSFIGTTRTPDTDTMPTVLETETVSYRHLIATINGTATYGLKKIGLSIDAPASEDDMFSFGVSAAGCTTPDFLDRGGQRVVGWNFDIGVDSAVETALGDTLTEFTSANSFDWDNAGATTANRGIKITFGNSAIDGGRTTPYSHFGRRVESVKMKAYDATSPRVLAVVIDNARTSIPA